MKTEKELIEALQDNLSIVINKRDWSIEPYNNVIDEDLYSMCFYCTVDNLRANAMQALNQFDRDVYVLNFQEMYMGVIKNEKE